MINDLLKRLDDLKVELAEARPEQRDALLDRVEQAVLGLEAQCGDVPVWAKSLLAQRIDQTVEDMFDNMPV